MREERSANTVEKYLQDAQGILSLFWVRTSMWTRSGSSPTSSIWPEHYKTVSANSMLAAVNRLLFVLDWRECQVRLLRVQKRSFRETEKGTDQKRVSAAAGRREKQPEQSGVAADAGDLQHRHPGKRAPVHHGGGGAAGPRGVRNKGARQRVVFRRR